MFKSAKAIVVHLSLSALGTSITVSPMAMYALPQYAGTLKWTVGVHGVLSDLRIKSAQTLVDASAITVAKVNLNDFKIPPY